jgi:hypothetical protein
MPDPTSSTQRMVTADILTPSYRVVGKILSPHTGVLGFLNDTTTRFMEVFDAKLARLHMPSKLVGEYKVVDMVKANIFAICLTRREDIGPQALARGGYQNLTRFPLRLTTQIYEVEGTLEWSGRFEFSAVMVEGIREFVPLYDATLTAILIPALKIESPAILFNRAQVDMLAQIGDKK